LPHLAGQRLAKHGLDENQSRDLSGITGRELHGDVGAEAVPCHDGARIALGVEDSRQIRGPFGHADAPAVKRQTLAAQIDPQEVPRIPQGRPGHEFGPPGHVAGEPVEQHEDLAWWALPPEPVGDDRAVGRPQGPDGVEHFIARYRPR